MKKLKLRGWVKVVIILLIIIFTYNLIKDINKNIQNKYQIEDYKIQELIKMKGNK